MGKTHYDIVTEYTRLFQAIFEKTPIGIAFIDMKGRFAACNAALERMLGFPREELRTKDALGIIHPVDLPSALPLFRELMEQKREYHQAEARFLRKDGTVLTGRVTVSLVEEKEGIPPFMVGIFEDVTDKKQAEEAHRESQRALETLMSNLPGMAYRCRNDRDWTMEFVSEGCYALTEYQPEDLIANRRISYAGLVHPDDREDVWHTVQGALQEKEPFKIIYRIITSTGRMKWVWEQGRGVFSPIGELLALEGFVTDITERKRAEEEVETLNKILSSRAAELEASNRGLEEFNHTVSHDLRTPLANIDGCCHVIRELCGDMLDERCRDFLHTIFEETKRMDQLIDTLLNFSQLARCELQVQSVNLSNIAKTITSELKFKYPERRVKVTVADAMPATGDPRLLRLVLENLLDNAWKYTGKRKTAHVEVGIAESEGKPVYFVRDNGAGFRMMDADRLFTPFCRLHTRGYFKGHGIGLATVARIIQRHGGSVWAEGKPGKGATFYFTL